MKFTRCGLTHRLRPRGDLAGRIKIAPNRDPNITTDQRIDGIEKARMHFREVDSSEISDARLCGRARSAAIHWQSQIRY